MSPGTVRYEAGSLGNIREFHSAHWARMRSNTSLCNARKSNGQASAAARSNDSAVGCTHVRCRLTAVSYFCLSFLYTTPSFITKNARSVRRMFSVGSPGTAMTSASLPA